MEAVEQRPVEAVDHDVATLLDTLSAGGVGIVPLSVAYAICASREDGVRRIFAAKNRSYEKPSGMLANAAISRAIHILDDWKHDLVETVIKEDNLPFSVVAPYRSDHPFFADVEPFVMQSSSKVGTLDMLLNAGSFHDCVARKSWARQQPVFGSSANTSLSGSKFNYADIEPGVRNAADVFFDYGQSQYVNSDGRSSTIIDFSNWQVLRKGVVFDQVEASFAKRGVHLQYGI